MSDTEHEDLQNLLTHPGWLRWLEFWRTEWGATAYAQKVDLAAARDDLLAVKALPDTHRLKGKYAWCVGLTLGTTALFGLISGIWGVFA